MCSDSKYLAMFSGGTATSAVSVASSFLKTGLGAAAWERDTMRVTPSGTATWQHASCKTPRNGADIGALRSTYLSDALSACFAVGAVRAGGGVDLGRCDEGVAAGQAVDGGGLTDRAGVHGHAVLGRGAGDDGGHVVAGLHRLDGLAVRVDDELGLLLGTLQRKRVRRLRLDCLDDGLGGDRDGDLRGGRGGHGLDDGGGLRRDADRDVGRSPDHVLGRKADVRDLRDSAGARGSDVGDVGKSREFGKRGNTEVGGRVATEVGQRRDDGDPAEEVLDGGTAGLSEDGGGGWDLGSLGSRTREADEAVEEGQRGDAAVLTAEQAAVGIAASRQEVSQSSEVGKGFESLIGHGLIGWGGGGLAALNL